MMTSFAEVPNCPGCGGPNAAVLNQPLTDRWLLGRLGFPSSSGRIETIAGVVLVVKAVFVGSGPVHIGVRKPPEKVLKTLDTFHPPTNRFTSLEDPASQWRPLPNGI